MITLWRSDWWTDCIKRLTPYHLPVGEATVTLQDVVILLDLWFDGRAVTSQPTHDWVATYGELLALTPDGPSLDGARLRSQWLRDRFGVGSTPNTIDHVVRQDAMVYILALIRSVISPDKSGSDVSLVRINLYYDTLRRSATSHGTTPF